jgi:uncharacterized protein YkwD
MDTTGMTRHLAGLLAALALTAGAAAGQLAPPAAPPAAPATVVLGAEAISPDVMLARVVELTNAERMKAGAPPLALEPRLSQAAQGYVELMAGTGCFSHSCGPLPELGQRAEVVAYTRWMILGENLAAGQPGADEAVAAWMASPPHRENLLDPRYVELGVGLTRGGVYGWYWAQEFGTRGPDAPAATGGAS